MNSRAILLSTLATWLILSGCSQDKPGTAPTASAPPAVTDFAAEMTMTAGKDGGSGRVFGHEGKIRTKMKNSAILDTRRQTAIVLFEDNTQYTEIVLNKPLPKQEPPKPPQVPAGSGLAVFTQERRAPLFPRELAWAPLPDLQSSPCTYQPDATCTKVGTEELNGRKADKWEMKTEANPEPKFIWIDHRLRIAIRTQQGDSSYELKNIQEGPQDPTWFQVPAGYTRMELGKGS